VSLLGVDVGTTGTKAVAFDTEGNILASAYREYRLLHPQPGFVEVDANEMWHKVHAVIGEAAHAVKATDPVEALAVSSLGEGIGAYDADRQPLSNTVTALDARGSAEARWLQERLGREHLFDLTGQPCHCSFSVNRLLWWRNHQPDVYKKAWKFLCCEEMVYTRLGLEPTTDYSIATRTMCFDLHQLQWSDEILDATELSADRFARVAPSGTVIGEVPRQVADELGLKRGAVAVVGGFDQPCAALGGGVVDAGMCVDGLGTVECITLALDEPTTDRRLLAGNIPCFPHVVDGMYAVIGYNFAAGSLLRWFRDNFCQAEVAEAKRTGVDPYDLICAQASEGPSDVLSLPHFTGTGTPYLDPDSKGAIVGLTLATNKGDLIKAIVDGATYEIALNIEMMRNAGIEIKELRATGGGAKSELWLQTKADITGLPVLTLNVTEGGCLATAILAGVGIGKFKSIRDAAHELVRVTACYGPNPGLHEQYREKYEQHKRLYPALSPITHELEACL